jgi:dihydroorotate dehydrogenase electron transfer subunit
LSVCHTEANWLRTTPILDVKTESPTVKTVCFKDKLCAGAKPGQFLMLWVPGVDEIPFSILGSKAGDIVRVAVRKVGEATQALHEKKPGDLIGIRGPFGNSFSPSKGKVLIVAGGTGTVPMLFLSETLLSKASVTFVLGAKTKKELIFIGEIKRQLVKSKLSLITSTEDGTGGITGLCTDPVERILREEKPDMVYACGPEQMLLKVFEICEKRTASLEVSLERLMRCAIGLCGSCVIGKYRVCTDGPVFTKKQLQETKAEFGFSKLDLDGRKMRI